MRLDHLLSKEHWHLGFSGPLGLAGSHGVSRWPLHGRVCRGGCSWVDHRLVGTAHLVALASTGFCSFGGGGQERGVGGWVVLGTLLGPEGSGASFSSSVGPHLLSVPPWVPLGVWGWRARVVGFRPYFENYTVDASIFVAKFLRAHGGCLGTRNRRRT